MKSSILTITLTALVAATPLRAQQSFFDTLLNAIQQNPKTTLLCALAGCAVSAKIAYSTAYESTLKDRKMAEFLQSHPMIMLFGEPITDEQQSLLKNFKLYPQGDRDYPLCLFLHEADNAHSKELINEPRVQDYRFVHPREDGQPFSAVAYSLNLQTCSGPSTINYMFNNKYNEGRQTGYERGKQDGFDAGHIAGKQAGNKEGYEHGKQEGDQAGYQRGRDESSSGKIKDKVKKGTEKVRDKLTN